MGLFVKRAKQGERLTHREFVGELGFLQLNTEPFAQRPPLGALAPGRTEDLDGAAVGRREALENLDGGGLPRPVRAEQPETLAGADREIETGNGNDVTEALGEGATTDRYDVFFSLSFSGGASCACFRA